MAQQQKLTRVSAPTRGLGNGGAYWDRGEQTSHESPVEVGADLNDFVSAEPADPTIPVIKPETILSAGEGA
jgi:hypothetical protein